MKRMVIIADQSSSRRPVRLRLLATVNWGEKSHLGNAVVDIVPIDIDVNTSRKFSRLSHDGVYKQCDIRESIKASSIKLRHFNATKFLEIIPSIG